MEGKRAFHEEIMNVHSRYYNPERGRFLNIDAIGGNVGALLSHNIFAYCNNNPVTAKDPSGFRPIYTQGEETAAMRDASYKAMAKIAKRQAIATVPNNKLYKAETFYLEGEGPRIDFNKNDLSIKAQLVSAEAGLATIYDEYKYGKWALKSPYIISDIGLNISKQPKASLYGKISLFSIEGSVFIPIPFTNSKFEIGLEGDIFSIGGGLVVDVEKKKIKAGYHLGFGGDIILGIDLR